MCLIPLSVGAEMPSSVPGYLPGVLFGSSLFSHYVDLSALGTSNDHTFPKLGFDVVFPGSCLCA